MLQWFRCYTGDQRALFSFEKLFLTLLSGIFFMTIHNLEQEVQQEVFHPHSDGMF